MARATETGGTGSPSEWPIAIAASCLAGFVDALGFLASKGFFVSFMSGNSTQLGAEIAGGATLALVPVALVLAFVAGALSGALVARRSGTRRRPVVLTLVAAVLAAAALSAWQGANALALVAMAAAMGAENAAIETNGEVKIAVTYMTGTLVKVGQRIADALEGGKRWAWLPYVGLWAGMVVGAAGGALLHPRLGLAGLWLAVAGAAGLAAWSAAAAGRG